jgi:hypothetical protein
MKMAALMSAGNERASSCIPSTAPAEPPIAMMSQFANRFSFFLLLDAGWVAGDCPNCQRIGGSKNRVIWRSGDRGIEESGDPMIR